jgi:WD40 repeat protein
MNHKNTCKYERHVSFRNERHLKILNTSILDFNWIISETFKKKFFFFAFSVAFTHDSQRLYSTSSDGTVALWESTSSSRPLSPHTFLALF